MEGDDRRRRVDELGRMDDEDEVGVDDDGMRLEVGGKEGDRLRVGHDEGGDETEFREVVVVVVVLVGRGRMMMMRFWRDR